MHFSRLKLMNKINTGPFSAAGLSFRNSVQQTPESTSRLQPPADKQKQAKATCCIALTDMFTQFEQLKNLLELPVQLASTDSTASSSPTRHSFAPSSSDLLLLSTVLFLRCGRVDPHRSRTHTSPSIRKMDVFRKTRCTRGEQQKFRSGRDVDMEEGAVGYG